MKKLLLAAAAVLPCLLGCNKPAAQPGAQAAAAQPAADPSNLFVVETVDPAADMPPPPHPKPQPKFKPIGPKPKGFFAPTPGHPYPGGMHGPWAKHWLGHHHHGQHYLYGLYQPTWRGYTYRVWNGRWLYWSPEDYCWYRFDESLGAYIPLNPDGTDAIDMAASAPPPPPPPPPE